MMITTPSAPGGAAAAQSALPGVAIGGAPALAEGVAAGGIPAQAEGTAAGGTGLPALFAQLLDFAGLATPAANAAAQPAAAQPAAPAADAEPAAEEAPAEAPLAAMMPVLHFAVLPAQQQAAQAQAAATAATNAAVDAAQVRGVTAGAMTAAATASGARQAAADAITNGTAVAATVAATPLAARLLQGALPATVEPVAPKAGADVRQGAAGIAANGAATQAAATATVLAAQDGAAQSGKDGQSGQQPQGDGQATFRGVMAASAPVAGAAAPADTVKLAGTPEQWQQPLRAALGDRLQVTLQKGNDQAVIRLEPPNLGSIEISIRQTAGALHVSMSATNSEVVRQLNAVGDSMRQDLSQRQQGDVAVTVSQASSRSLADSEGRGRQPERDAEQQREQRGPGRALNEGDVNNTTFALRRE